MPRAMFIPVSINYEVRIMEVPGADELKAIQELVGGWFEGTTLQMAFSPHEVGVTFFVNETGLLDNLPINQLATLTAAAIGDIHPHGLRGPAVLIANNGEGESIDLPQEWINLVEAIRAIPIAQAKRRHPARR